MASELVVLTPDLEDLAIAVANERYKRNREAGRINQLNDTSKTNELAGARAEVAVRYYLQLPLDFDVLCLQSPDGGVDIEINRFTIDVKWCWSMYGGLTFLKASKFKALSAVLVVPTISPAQLRIVGIISRKKFFEKCYFRDIAKVPHKVLSVSQDDLSPLILFEKYLKTEGIREWKSL